MTEKDTPAGEEPAQQPVRSPYGYSPDRNRHREMPGTGVMYQTLPERKKTPRSPDYKGFVTLKHDYRKGDKVKMNMWAKHTSVGTLLTVMENDLGKQKEERLAQEAQEHEVERNTPREVVPAYDKPRRLVVDDDDEMELLE